MGDRLVRVGAVVFAAGIVLLLGAAVPFFFGRDNLPLVLNLGALAAPAGLGLALIGLYAGARASQRQARESAPQHQARDSPAQRRSRRRAGQR